MEQLLLNIAKGLVEDKQAVEVTKEDKEDGVVVYHLKVAQQDTGRVIGKQGRIAKAIRTVIKAASINTTERVIVEID